MVAQSKNLKINMKKLLSIVAALAFVTSASAQVVASYDFEDGTNKGWSVWDNKTNEIVKGSKAEGVTSGEYAMEVAIGTSFGFTSKTPKMKYKVTADVFNKWGDADSYLKISYYDKVANKMITQEPVSLPSGKGTASFSHTFKAKDAGLYRVLFYGKKGRFVLDNVKVEVVK